MGDNGGHYRNIDEDWQPDLDRRGEDTYGEGHPRRVQEFSDRKHRKGTFPEPRTHGRQAGRSRAGFSYNEDEQDLRYGNLGSTAYDPQGETSTSLKPDKGVSQNDQRPYGRHRGKGPKNYQRSDERVYDDVNRRLADDDFIDASNVVVEVRNCEVTLSGTVDDRESKRRAEDVAEMVLGVRNVENRIRVQRNTDYQVRDGNSENRTMGTTRSNVNEMHK